MPDSDATLEALRPGETGEVIGLASELPEGERRRLLELGFFPGTPVLCSLESPLGDPIAYTVRGMTVGLRRTQARQIRVRRLPGGAA